MSFSGLKGTRLGLYHVDSEWDAGYDPVLWARWQPPVAVFLNPKAERIAQFHAACPRSLIIPRDHPLSEQQGDLHADPEGTGVRHARELHALRLRVAPGVPAEQVILVGVNEPAARPDLYDGQAVQHIVRYTVARLREHARLGDRGGGPDFGVTWPYYGQWEPYAEMHRVIRETNGVLTMHRYWRGDLGLDHEYAQWAGEFPEGWDDVPWILVECGDDGLLAERQKGANGWQTVMNAPTYLGQLSAFDARLRTRPNLLGACIFLWGQSAPWDSYNVRPLGPQLATYAEGLRAQPEAPVAESSLVLRPPLTGPVSQEFGERVVDYSRYGLYAHNGRDYAVPVGTPVVATHPGQCWVYDDVGYGQVVEVWFPEIAHPIFKTISAHGSKQVAVHGQRVEAGMVILLSGNTGNSTGPHLHYGFKPLRGPRGQVPVNPGYLNWVDPRFYLEG